MTAAIDGLDPDGMAALDAIVRLIRSCEADLAEQRLFFWAQADAFAKSKNRRQRGLTSRQRISQRYASLLLPERAC
jgi:hypothetical protein